MGSYLSDDFNASGSLLSLNADGSIVAIGSRSAVNDNYLITMYQWDGLSWIQLGDRIGIDFNYPNVGSRISLSADGYTVAATVRYPELSGSAKIFGYSTNNIWNQIGQTINGSVTNDLFGSSLSLNKAGNRVAIGANGYVKVFYFRGSEWVQLGDDVQIDSAQSGSNLNFTSVSLSEDGYTLAVGLPKYSNSKGKTSVYEYDFFYNSWAQIGNDLIGENDNDQFGVSISLSADGSTLSIGAPNNYWTTNPGKVYTYQWDEANWTQQGQTIYGSYAGSMFGKSVSLSEDGLTLAIGAPRDSYINHPDVDGVNSGSASIYEWDGSTWTSLGSDIQSYAPGHYTGQKISLSSDGSTVAIGSPGGNGENGYGNGHTEILKYSSIDSDGDGLIDGLEHFILGSSSNNADSDGDGWNDYFEYTVSGFSITNPSEIYLEWYASNSVLNTELATLKSATNFLSSQLNMMLTTNQAYAMLDAAHADDILILVSNNTAQITLALEQSTNLTTTPWNTNTLKIIDLPVDQNAAFFRFKLLKNN